MFYQLQGILYINLVLPLLATEHHTVASSTGPSQERRKKSVRTINQQDYDISKHSEVSSSSDYEN